MAKVATVNDNTLQPTSGKWVWKDDTNTLEFISHHADKQDKRRKNKGHHDKNRATSSIPRHGVGRGLTTGLPTNIRSPKATRRDIDNDNVTLEDIKRVSFNMMSDVDKLPESFELLYVTEEFDHFLLNLLTYFNCFFEKIAQENKKNPMYIEPSLAEKKAYADACERLAVGQKLLGRAYCILVLGLGLEKHHHMACGMSRVSSTYQDRSMFESFYNFCTFVVWITFRRKEYEIVKKEVGRMLRSDTFNPAIRVKYAADEVKETEVKDEHTKADASSSSNEVKLTPAQYRRLHPKRPAIKSIVNQRSPAIVALLPSPKEEAGWLFEKHSYSSQALPDNDDDDLTTEETLTLNLHKYRMGVLSVGILGEPFNQFNSITLSPIGADNEEDETTEAEDKQSCDNTMESTAADNRQMTAVSQITTEALSEA